MSVGQESRQRSHSTRSLTSTHSAPVRHSPPPTSLTPENNDAAFEPCAATASFLLYAQRNQILILHHDTLSIERRFELHREDIVWIAVDNVSDRGSGRLAVSFDAGKTAIVWDILSGGEVARFSAYEHMRVASFMRNGNIAFANDQGNIILFEPSTSEHVSARTIFDPITAIAPATDCRTFAIGYLNGSILIATLQPSFTILHTLNTSRSPSRITDLAWHGSSSKQKSDMLATQTSDGDLRVWSIPKGAHGELPNIIRVLQRPEVLPSGPCWFAWSKNGRIVQYADSETRAWDVRTKKVTYEIIPTCDGVIGLANYGPTATLFALGRNHAVYQYDVNPSLTPTQVASVQHAPANTPPTPPTMLEERKNPYTDGPHGLAAAEHIPFTFTDGESSADESAALSPLQKIAKEMDSLDALESEIRDKIMPLSPQSSRASSSASSKSSGRRTERKYLYDRPDSSRASSTTGYDGTEFSFGPPVKQGHESVSIRSVSSLPSTSNARHTRRSSNLRKEILRSPEDAEGNANMDLFPAAKARLSEVPFRTPHYGNGARTPDLLVSEMLSVVFGWNDDAQSLIHDELSRHRPGSAAAVLLAKWLGDVGADSMASMIGSESMTSSDWMLLALSSIGQNTQKKVGEAFVQRLLEKGDVHPAVAILLGLGETNDAIEVYVSQQYWLEAVLLTCLTTPSDWQRISYLIRKWGESAVTQGHPELAVRCFSCTSVETSEPWFSPRAQDAVYAAQQERFTQPLSAGGMTNPPLSPPSRSGSNRLAAKNASLKLITSFGNKGAPISAPNSSRPLTTALGVTPIAQSALSPGGIAPWKAARDARDPSTARTATPGGFQRRKRLPSRDDIARAKQDVADIATPLTAARGQKSRAPSLSTRGASESNCTEPTTAQRQRTYYAEQPPTESQSNYLPSPAKGAFSRFREQSRNRKRSRERKSDGLEVQIMKTAYTDPTSPGPSTDASNRGRGNALSPGSLTDGSARSAKGRAIDEYISSVEQARNTAREERAQSRKRNGSRKRSESRPGRESSRMRERSGSRARGNVKYIKPAKRSPSSPIPMSPEEFAQASGTRHVQVEPATTDDESFYKVSVVSPTGSQPSVKSFPKRKSADDTPRTRSSEKAALISELAALTLENERGRSQDRQIEPAPRSPSLPILTQKRFGPMDEAVTSSADSFRLRARSSSRQAAEDLQARRKAHRTDRERSNSRNPRQPSDEPIAMGPNELNSTPCGDADPMTPPRMAAMATGPRPRTLTRKEIAAQELEARRQSLARRPSAPSIPLPGDVRPILPRYHTDLGDSPTSYHSPISRSHTADPDMRYNSPSKITGMSTPSAPIGLPATPRAMRHPRYMSTDPNEREGEPPVPRIPGQYSDLSSFGSSLSQVTGSALSQASALSSDQPQSMLSSGQPSALSEGSDSVGPLLPSTVFGQKTQGLPSRSASAPPEKQAPVHPMYKVGLSSSNRRMSGGRGHIRKISPFDVGFKLDEEPTSIDAAICEDDTVIIVAEEDSAAPPILRELQHLAGPPPPPPPPTMFQPSKVNSSGVINIAIDENGPNSNAIDPQGPMLPMPMERAQTASPSMHRRNQSSSWMRGFGDRIRSSSKSRAKSPPMGQPAPYETVLPAVPGFQGHVRRESLTQRAKSPYEQAMAAAAAPNQDQIPVLPPPPPAPIPGQDAAKLNETSIPPFTLPSRSQSSSGYRNPKEIRANMPPEVLQPGVYQGMI